MIFKKAVIAMLLLAGMGSQQMVAQRTYEDYFGTGNTIGISSTSSQEAEAPVNSLNGTDLVPDLAGASRFLAHATLGYNYEEIEYVSQAGIKPWLEEQFALPGTPYLTTYEAIAAKVAPIIPNANALQDRMEFIHYSFWTTLMNEEDYLRQKVAFSLSQILVISTQATVLANNSRGTIQYYDILYQNAFGNYRDILDQVTNHATMGTYLSYSNNKKADYVLGTFPDENYAREVMQLFTIGLFELNNDGSYKLNAAGKPIPTYDNEDIQELAKVFTGFGPGGVKSGTPSINNTNTDFNVPLAMYDLYHDKSEKTLVGGTVLPAGRSGEEDVSDALDALFNHPNTGPFISFRMIQQMVKSNPSPQYINRVARVFNNNGKGVRGDLKAVVTAILTDPEALDCEWDTDASAGKLLQPLERMTQLCKAFDLATPSGDYWFRDNSQYGNSLEQSFMRSPSVFNYFSPFYAEKELIEPVGLVSPEFQLLYATTSILYLNLIESAIKTKPFNNYTAANSTASGLTTNTNDVAFFDFSDEINEVSANGVAALIDRLNILLCRGQLSAGNQTLIENAITQYYANVNGYTDTQAVQDAIYFIMASPDYLILK